MSTTHDMHSNTFINPAFQTVGACSYWAVSSATKEKHIQTATRTCAPSGRRYCQSINPETIMEEGSIAGRCRAARSCSRFRFASYRYTSKGKTSRKIRRKKTKAITRQELRAHLYDPKEQRTCSCCLAYNSRSSEETPFSKPHNQQAERKTERNLHRQNSSPKRTALAKMKRSTHVP